MASQEEETPVSASPTPPPVPDSGLITTPQQDSAPVDGTPVSKKSSTKNPKKPSVVIVQWNQKDLTLLEERADGYAQSHERIQKLGRTIRDMNNMPSVCVFEEIRTGGGGLRALTEIVKYLNTETSDNTWTFKTSGEVNPQGRRRELYAVLWRTSVMGNLIADKEENGHRLMTDGFNPVDKLRATSRRQDAAEEEEKEDTLNVFKIGQADINMSEATELWKNMDKFGNVNLYFDRAPVLFSFKPHFTNFEIHILVTHGATGGETKSPYQNMIESAFLQSIATQAIEQNEYLVLLGDFNTAEDHNHTERMWDVNIPLSTNPEEDEPDEQALFGAIKNKFLENYYRGIHASLPTNVYPFLAGGSSVPKHNDDIWVPYDDQFMDIVNLEGQIDGKGNNIEGIVHRIPDFVTQTWELKSRAYFNQLGVAELRGASKHTLNRLLSMSWSDHRPISVKLTPRSFRLVGEYYEKCKSPTVSSVRKSSKNRTPNRTSVSPPPAQPTVLEMLQTEESKDVPEPQAQVETKTENELDEHFMSLSVKDELNC